MRRGEIGLERKRAAVAGRRFIEPALVPQAVSEPELLLGGLLRVKEPGEHEDAAKLGP